VSAIFDVKSAEKKLREGSWNSRGAPRAPDCEKCLGFVKAAGSRCELTRSVCDPTDNTWSLGIFWRTYYYSNPLLARVVGMRLNGAGFLAAHHIHR
jgi:hypothetical protein